MPMRPPPTRRLTTLATVTVAGLLTVGCTGSTGPVLDTAAAIKGGDGDAGNAGTEAADSAHKGPTLFGVPSSKLPFEPGQIDPVAHPDEQFNPCTEISPEIYRQAGIELEIKPDMDKLAGYVASCSGHKASTDASPHELGGERFQILSSRSTLVDLQNQGIEVLEISEEDPFSPHLINGTADRNECASGVNTDRGRWEIMFIPALNTGNTAESCKRAREAHETITKLIGGNAQ
ncbi:hypothetical protein [Corynebacterium frankenforstense]